MPTNRAMTDLPLKDRIALVVGASRGIGYESALALAKAGAHVIATARTVGGLEELDDAIFAATGKHATLIPFDLVDGSHHFQLSIQKDLERAFGHRRRRPVGLFGEPA